VIPDFAKYARPEWEDLVIGGVVLAGEMGGNWAARACGDFLKLDPERDFFVARNQGLARAIQGLIKAGAPVHPETVYYAAPDLWAEGASQYRGLAAVMEIAARAADRGCVSGVLAWYVKQLQIKGAQRAFLAHVLDHIGDLGDGDAEELRLKVENILARIEMGEPVPTFAEVMKARVEDLIAQRDADAMAVERTAKAFVPWAGLRRFQVDVEPGAVCVVGARTSIGKTAFGMDWAMHHALTGRPVVYVSLEMSAAQLANRALAWASGIAHHQIRRGFVTEEQARALLAAADAAPQNMRVLDVSVATVGAIFAQIRSLGLAMAPLVVLDYLQLLKAPSNLRASRQEQVAEIARQVKVEAKSLGVPVVALTQLRRLAPGEKEEAPTLHQLRESGDIENSADIVMLLHRDRRSQVEPAVVTVLIEKNRSGVTGQAQLLFFRDQQRFEDLVEDAG